MILEALVAACSVAGAGVLIRGHRQPIRPVSLRCRLRLQERDHA